MQMEGDVFFVILRYDLKLNYSLCRADYFLAMLAWLIEKRNIMALLSRWFTGIESKMEGISV